MKRQTDNTTPKDSLKPLRGLTSTITLFIPFPANFKMSTDFSKDPDFQYLAVDRKKLLEAQTQPFDGKKACWVPDEKEGFARAEIVSSKGEEVTVKTVDTNEVRFLSA